MDWLLLLGRILFAMLFIAAGVAGHLQQRKGSTEYARSLGAPAPDLLVPLSGIWIIVAGAMVVLGIWVDLAALMLIAFLVPIAFIMHAFWKIDDPMMKIVQLSQFQKNMALAGASLVLFFLFQQYGEDIGLTIEPALFD
ncbi:MAG: DoxX family protein [Gaiellaceae bacterium]